MGSGSFSTRDWQTYATNSGYANKSASQIFTQRSVNADMDPRKFKFRESCDSVDNPNSTAIATIFDNTSSMGMIAEVLAKKGIPTLMQEIIDRKPVTDPHLLIGAVNDVRAGCDAPLQTSQFEADNRIVTQSEQIYLEGKGGGNGSESYALAWYFVAMKTKIDCFDKRGRKGLLFTIGDDGPTPDLTAGELEQAFGPGEYKDISAEELLTLASRQWDIYHIMVAEGQTHSDHVRKQWESLLGERAVLLKDHEKLAEVVVSLIQLNAGTDHKDVVDSWTDKSTALVVQAAINGVTRGVPVAQQQGVVTL